MKRKHRIIEQLRAMFPATSWTYEPEYESRRWVRSDGRSVEGRCALASRYDGDDDSFEVVYVWTDTGERLYGLTSLRVLS